MTTVLAGDQFQIKQELTKIKQQFKQSRPTVPVDLQSAAKFGVDGLISAVSASALFSQPRLLILYDLDVWLEQVKSQTELSPAQLVGEICQPDESTQLVIVLEKSSKIKADWFGQNQIDFRLFKERNQSQIKAWIQSEFKRSDVKISPATAALLAERSNFQSEIIQSEINKLVCYDEIDNKLIVELTSASPKSQIFDLVENICRGNIKQTLNIYYQQRSLGEIPIKILGLINWQIRNLVLAKTDKKTPNQIAKALNLKSDYSLTKIAGISRRLNQSQIQQLIDCLVQTDYRLRCQFLDPDRCLEILMIKSCYLIRRRF